MVSPHFCLCMNSRRNQLLHIALLISFGCGTNTFEDLTLGLNNIDETFFIIFLTFLDQTTNQLIKKVIRFSSGCIILKLQKLGRKKNRNTMNIMHSSKPDLTDCSKRNRLIKSLESLHKTQPLYTLWRICGWIALDCIGISNKACGSICDLLMWSQLWLVNATV